MKLSTRYKELTSSAEIINVAFSAPIYPKPSEAIEEEEDKDFEVDPNEEGITKPIQHKFVQQFHEEAEENIKSSILIPKIKFTHNQIQTHNFKNNKLSVAHREKGKIHSADNKIPIPKDQNCIAF